MNTKYEILMDEKNSRVVKPGSGVREITVHRIKALKDIGEEVKAGDVGGFIESEDNLDIYDDSWIYDSAIVCGNAVIENSEVRTHAFISDHVTITEKSKISGRAVISGNVRISNSIVDDDAHITGCVTVSKNSYVNGDADLRGNVCMIDSVATGMCKLAENVILHNSHVLEYASLGGSCKIVESTVKDNAYVAGNAIVISSVVKDKAEVKDSVTIANCIVKEEAVLLGRANLDGHLTIHNSDQVFSVASFNPKHSRTPLGASARLNGPTFFFTGKKIRVIDGQLYCSLEEYVDWAIETFGDKYRKEYEMICDLARIHFENIYSLENKEIQGSVNKVSSFE